MDSYNQSNVETIRLESVEWAGARRATQTIRTPITMHSVLKRSIDIVGSLIGIVLLIPVFMLIAVVVKWNDPRGSVFFRQSRIGRHSRMFKIIKFRSMVHNAQTYLQQDKKLYEKYISNNYKLEHEEDPRITSIGRFLRKTSLDELPQLINVLRGEMSLVGPRPIIYEELREYGEKSSDFLSVKPGLTGYWQISGRSNVGYPERTDLELHYVYNQSIVFDFRILIKTVWVVLFRSGAY